jgi:hypothetical protein
MNIILGPYIGSIEQALFTFYPHTLWIYNCLLSHNYSFYISSHDKHRFLYDWAGITYVPVDIGLSNDDDHHGIMNSKISNKDYLVLLKQLKNSINGDNTIHCYVRYTKYSNFTIPVSKKRFAPLNIKTEVGNDIFVINRNDDSGITRKVHELIPGSIEINTIDVNSTEEILGMLLSARMVICPCGEWTYFCNLHKIPVFSWGLDGIGMYKPNGIYHFDNFKSEVMYTNGNIDVIMSGIKYLEGKI